MAGAEDSGLLNGMLPQRWLGVDPPPGQRPFMLTADEPNPLAGPGPSPSPVLKMFKADSFTPPRRSVSTHCPKWLEGCPRADEFVGR